MKKVQQGFTLIELMIVVAIIGILAAIAIPQYQDYIARSQMNRSYLETAALKTAVEDALQRGDESQLGNGAVSLGASFSSLMTNSGLPGVVYNAGAATVVMTTTLGNAASTAISGATVVLSRSAGGNWTCLAAKAGAGAGWKESYIPKGCEAP